MFLDSPSISNVIFYPRKHEIPNGTNLNENIQVLKFQLTDEITIGGFFYLNKPDLPSILLFHGNGELAIEYQYFAPLFFECGVNLAVMDFRGYGFSSGHPFFSSLYLDALPIYENFNEWIKEKNYNNSIFVLGRSLGSFCAAEIGSHNPTNLHGIIFESGVGNTFKIMTRLFNITIPEIKNEILNNWSNDMKVSKFNIPTLIIHGTSDWIVPYEHAQILFKSIPQHIEKKLITIKGAGHNNIFSFKDQYFPPLKDFITKYK